MATESEMLEMARKSLEAMGFEVRRLGERETAKTPDLLAIRDEKFVIEVKQKKDDVVTRAEKGKVARQGGLHVDSAQWGPKNTISGLVRDAAEQLEAWADKDYGLVWIHAEGELAESQFQQFEYTLMGVTHVIDMSMEMTPCYFFYDSPFFRYRKVIDGAILSIGSEGKFWVNPYSDRSDRLKKSTLAAAFVHAMDARDLEDRGEIFLADCEIDRKDSTAIKRYLAKKYGTGPLDHMHVGELRLTHFSECAG